MFIDSIFEVRDEFVRDGHKAESCLHLRDILVIHGCAQLIVGNESVVSVAECFEVRFGTRSELVDGHQAGDEYIKSGCSIICNLFKYSPIYRIGGDEFVVIAKGRDYQDMDLIMAELEKINIENQKAGNVVIACGAARYNGERNVAGVFDKADKRMYENKKQLKNYNIHVVQS